MKKWFQKPSKLKSKSRCGEKKLLTKNCKNLPKNKEHAIIFGRVLHLCKNSQKEKEKEK
jgi:hypothetical protein